MTNLDDLGHFKDHVLLGEARLAEPLVVGFRGHSADRINWKL